MRIEIEAADQSIIDGDPARERKNYAGVGFSYDGTDFIHLNHLTLGS